MNLKFKYVLILLGFFLPIYLFRLWHSLQLPYQEGDKIKIIAQLGQEPIVRGQWQYFKIKGISIRVEKELELHYGDQIQIIGTAAQSQAQTWPSRYYLSDIKISKLKTSSSIINSLFQYRQKLEQILIRFLPDPQASLLIGIILGIQKSFAYDFYQALQTTGTLHLIVASGMNVSLIAGNLKELLAHWLKRKPALFVSLIIVLIYCVIVGASPPIVRASIMAASLYLGEFLGREGRGLWILTLTAAIMLIINPLLLFDIGFQLSWLATAGIIILQPFLEKKAKKIFFVRIFRSELSETLAAMIFTLPVLIINFGHFNPLAIIPNMLILPLVPYLFYLGVIVLCLGLLARWLGLVFGWLTWLPLTYMTKTIALFGQLKFFDLRLENFTWLFSLGYYLILLVFINRVNPGVDKNKWQKQPKSNF